VIPTAAITAWRAHAPWIDDAQVEQDLALSRALVELFSEPIIAGHLAFRGGTALNKLHFVPPARYSEDLDLVQVVPGPLGEIMGAVRGRLGPWLGEPKWKQTQGRVTFVYRFDSEAQPVTSMKLKVEINTREHFAVLGLAQRPFAVENPWFSGACTIPTYELAELLGTKLRALYQRRKGRDLFDLHEALERLPDLDPALIITCFERYMAHGETPVSRAEFEANLAAKMALAVFLDDMALLLVPGQTYKPGQAHARIQRELLARLSGGPPE